MQQLALFAVLLFCTGVTSEIAAQAPAQTPATDDADQAFRSGRYQLAAESYANRVEAGDEDALAWYRLGYSLHALGKIEEALVAHERAATFAGPNQATAAYNAACAHALLGHVDPAIDWLQKAVGFGFGSAAQLEVDPDLASLRGDERFNALFKQRVHADTFRYLRAIPKGAPDQFDFWIGEWDTAVWAPNSSNSWAPSGSLTMKVEPVAGGQALVEWAEGTMGGGNQLGFSVRVYDPAIEAWTLILCWPNTNNPFFYSMRGGFRHGRGEFVSGLGGAGGGLLSQSKFTFSDAGKDHLRWDGSATADSGRTWNTNLLFEFTRRSKGADALLNGPSRSNDNAALPIFRELDFLLGRWIGTRTLAAGDSSAVELEIVSVMEGSALTFVRTVELTGGEKSEFFAVAANDPTRQAWVCYEIVEGTPRFERFEGTATENQIYWTGKAGPGSSGSSSKTRWVLDGDILKCERFDSAGAVLWREEYMLERGIENR